MNERTTVPLMGVLIGFISYESFQSILFSIFVAFLGGIAAWIGKKLCEKFEKWWLRKEAAAEHEKMD